MIKTVRIDITAGNPETPLGDFVAFVGSAISFTLTNVPRELGKRVIERVAIEARTHQGIIRSFEGERVGSAWGVTIADDFFTHPCYVKNGIKVTAFGTGNDGAAEQWTLGIGDITILENTVTIQPLDELQELVVVDGAYLENPKKGYFDLGGMRIYDGTRWVEVGGGGAGATVLTMNGGKLYNGTKEITKFTELLALVQAGGVVLKGEVSGKVALFYPLFCDANAVRFDATGTLGSAVQTKSYAMTPKTGGGITISPSGLTELAKKTDVTGIRIGDIRFTGEMVFRNFNDGAMDNQATIKEFYIGSTNLQYLIQEYSPNTKVKAIKLRGPSSNTGTWTSRVRVGFFDLVDFWSTGYGNIEVGQWTRFEFIENFPTIQDLVTYGAHFYDGNNELVTTKLGLVAVPASEGYYITLGNGNASETYAPLIEFDFVSSEDGEGLGNMLNAGFNAFAKMRAVKDLPTGASQAQIITKINELINTMKG